MLALALVGTACPGDDSPMMVVDTESSSSGDATSGPTTMPTTMPTTTPTTGTDGTDDTSTSGVDSTGTTDGPTCGDDMVDAGEDCDGTDLGGADCASEGFDDGTLACADDCTFDTSGCISFSCGNDAIEGREMCDGSDLGGADCASEGFDGGTLACADDCTFDTSGCSTCGNDAIEGAEVCDGADLGGTDCAGEGFDGGTLACAADCSALDTSGCTACGDGVAAGAEVCDGLDLAGETCVTQGATAGTLACAADCGGYDTSSCSTCGNGAIEGAEVCDGNNLGGASCATQGFSGGSLGCTGTCTYDVTSCTNPAGYGNCLDFPAMDVCTFEEVCATDAGMPPGVAVCLESACGGVVDCAPAPPGGNAPVTCADVTGDGINDCYLNCAGGQTCPTGMTCFAGNLCVWGGNNFTCSLLDLGSALGSPVVGGNTAGFGNDFAPGCTAGMGNSEDVEVHWTAPANGNYTFDTAGSNYDTILSLYVDCVGIELACNDDDPGLGGGLSSITIPMVAGQSVLIVIDGFNVTGDFSLNISN